MGVQIPSQFSSADLVLSQDCSLQRRRCDMARFNVPTPLRQPDTFTAQGGEGFSRSPKDELFVLGMANMVGVDTFYERGGDRDKRFADLIAANARSDPAWTQAFIGWLRSEANMRSAPVVAAAEYVRSGAPEGRKVITSVLQRPDEPGELLGYWLSHYGRKLPQPVKRGIADALPRLYTERNVLRYDGTGDAIRFGDVIELVHPKPQRGPQSTLYRHLIDRRHGRGERPSVLALLAKDTELQALPSEQRRAHLADAIECGWSWERLSGWLPGGMDKEAWEAVIPNMGLMALARNLRNFDKVDLSGPKVLEVTTRFMNPEEVRKSRQFPLRFLSAWKAVASLRWGLALEGALKHSVNNVPVLEGRSLFLVDVSGSMQDAALSRRTDGRADEGVALKRWEVATLFAGALAQRSKDPKDADVVFFNTQPVSRASVFPSDSILRFVEQSGRGVGGGTNVLGSLVQAYKGHDRVVVLTDEQTGVAGSSEYMSHIRCPVFIFNLAGYKVGVTPNERNWHTIGGLTDACFRLIPILEGRQKGLWPWELPSEQVAA